uniref:Uncharacterized protein n=1 Tax=uncultured marine thaumarchaeote KM3_59_E10 TaxID=1456211 RepID=A0A075HD11_9ARCH|nr:hypothetical protein [uncultured marine thaumarchaeote KM3_59_E10]
MLTHEIQVNETKYSIIITDQIINQANNLKSLYNAAYEDPESFEQVSAQISDAIQEITSSVKPATNDNHLDGLIQEIIKIVDSQAVQVEKQSKEKTNKKVKSKK